jgi:hypothetical protein
MPGIRNGDHMIDEAVMWRCGNNTPRLSLTFRIFDSLMMQVPYISLAKSLTFLGGASHSSRFLKARTAE